MMRHILLVTALAILASGCVIDVSLAPRAEPLEETTVWGEGRAKVVMVDLSGVITDEKEGGLLGMEFPSTVDRVREEFEKAAEDRNVVGLILRVNSPGGTVTASDIIHHEVMAFRERTKLPVYAVIMDVGASGGYYAAVAADRIYAHPTAVTGSIGVIAMSLNLEGLMEKIGVEDKTVKSGAMKDIFSPFRPDTPEEQEVMQEIIDSLHERFVETVAVGRKMDRQKIAELADGRPYTARQALDSGLVDEVGYLQDAVEAMKVAVGAEEIRVVTYHRPGSRRGTIYSSLPFQGIGSIGSVARSSDVLTGRSRVRFMYLWGVGGL